MSVCYGRGVAATVPIGWIHWGWSNDPLLPIYTSVTVGDGKDTTDDCQAALFLAPSVTVIICVHRLINRVTTLQPAEKGCTQALR